MVVKQLSAGMILIALAVIALVIALVLVYIDPAEHATAIQKMTLAGLIFGFVGLKLP